MRLHLFYAAAFFSFVAHAQTDLLQGKERRLNLGFLVFIPDYEIEFSEQPYESGGYRFIELLGGGLRFTSEFMLNSSFSLRFEPGAVINRPFNVPGTYKIKGRLSEIQAPLLLKFKPLKGKRINPYLIAGYLANYKFSDYSSDYFKRRMDSAEFGLGVDFKLKKGSIGAGIRLNEQISSDQLREYSQLGIMRTRSIMLCLNFDNR